MLIMPTRKVIKERVERRGGCVANFKVFTLKYLDKKRTSKTNVP